MQDLFGMVGALRRPRLLVSAARFGLEDYVRDIHLPRILRTGGTPAPKTGGTVLMRLIDLEDSLDARRRAGAADYSVARHVEVLIAVMAESRLLAAARPRAVTGSGSTALAGTGAGAETVR